MLGEQQGLQFYEATGPIVRCEEEGPNTVGDDSGPAALAA
jgi:hypothetical protein